MLAALDRHADTWGLPPANFYWIRPSRCMYTPWYAARRKAAVRVAPLGIVRRPEIRNATAVGGASRKVSHGRRKPSSEQQFGSDSFLDVVCNAVGIVLIFIVIAAMRMRKSPLPAPVNVPEASVTEGHRPARGTAHRVASRTVPSGECRRRRSRGQTQRRAAEVAEIELVLAQCQDELAEAAANRDAACSKPRLWSRPRANNNKHSNAAACGGPA